MAAEKKDPRFEADPKDFEVDLSQFESDIRLDTSLFGQETTKTPADAAGRALLPPEADAGRKDASESIPAALQENQTKELYSDAQTQTRASASGRIDGADQLPETPPSVSSFLDEASPAARKTTNEARKKKKRQSLIIAALFICGAAFFAGYLSLAEDRDAKAANTKFIFFFFAVVWLWFIISRGRKK